MSELHVVATIPAKPGSEEVVRDALRTLVEATRGEDGCRSYELYESGSTPGTFVTVERWADQSDLDAHLASPHIATAMAAAEGNLSGDIAIHPLVPDSSG